MQTTDTGLLFQTSQQLADASNRERKIVAAEKVGHPIKVSSKVLDLVIRDQDAWTAESGWQARRLDLKTGRTTMIYKGHKGPVTSLCLYAVSGPQPWLALLTSSWDKTIRVWDAKSGELLVALEGHSDFVKSVTVLPTHPPLLLSTSSDRSIRLWDLSPLEQRQAPTVRQVIKEHTRPVDTAAYKLPDENNTVLSVWTADSMGVIKEWAIEQTVPEDASPLRLIKDLPGHETSVPQLAVTDDGLWSASTDNTAKLHGSTSATLNHPSYVKTILPNPNGLPYILTGSEDEELRVWDASTLDDEDLKPIAVVSGHCGEVSAMDVWIREDGGKKSVVIVSAGLDATLRRWTVEELLNPAVLNYGPIPAPSDAHMTEEEERELAELMSDDDDDK